MLSEKEIDDLEWTFRKLDTDNDGKIPVADARIVYTNRLKNIYVVPEELFQRYLSNVFHIYLDYGIDFDNADINFTYIHSMQHVL